jgi:hypothetical protein
LRDHQAGISDDLWENRAPLLKRPMREIRAVEMQHVERIKHNGCAWRTVT